MTKRTVVWVASAERELGEIWFACGRSPKINKASHQIDRDLRDDAILHSDPLAEGLRVIERTPLRAVVELNEADMLVRVLSLSVVRM
ncbi:hypothetical protein NHH03_00025 [Stieleria sp. TO1_6]|uniref:hypothetical protein n=1 Tax=Stieleria tagensis TaxID=2956795 RepID=UPI00209AD5DB|nr:hypothetical protein [Stieleria tagensis]MCO8120105.1 hypothetical protein [Stieleria tagensis]